MPIVVGVGSAAGSMSPMGKSLVAAIEAAMGAAVVEAQADGLDLTKDADAIRARMLAARDRVKAAAMRRMLDSE